ncbi:MAG: Na+ dependent nucleoside transporter N-terminal domain-containing protein [Phycisphaerales bacterium]
MQVMQSLIGIVVLLTVALLLSKDRRGVPWKLVATGVSLQFVIAALCL